MFHHHGTSENPLPSFFSAPAAGGSHLLYDISCCGSGGGAASQMYHLTDLSPTSQSPPYSSSLPSSCHLLRTSSNLSTYTHISEPFPPVAFFSPSPSSSDLAGDFYSEPTVRRVFSTGDLQGMNAMQAAAENGGQEGLAGVAAARACRYSAEERKERIERYRNKRNQRNFQKKITYACRKTLADSRPRIHGRFARNGETETETELEAAEEISCFYENPSYSSYNSYDQTSTASFMTGNVYEDHHVHNQQQQQVSHNDGGTCGGGSDDGGVDGWCRQMQEVLAAEVEEDEVRRWDEETWAYLDVLTMDLLS